MVHLDPVPKGGKGDIPELDPGARGVGAAALWGEVDGEKLSRSYRTQTQAVLQAKWFPDDLAEKLRERHISH